MKRSFKAPQGLLRALVLAFASKSPVTGKEIMDEISKRSSGSWIPSPGSVYFLLEELLNEGLLMLMPHSAEKRYIATSKAVEELKRLAGEMRELLYWDLNIFSILFELLSPHEKVRIALIKKIAKLPEESLASLQIQ